jgi:predicted ATPase
MMDPFRIKQIEVDGLFGLFNHRVPLSFDDRVTIVHGPNGVGKTTLLRLIEAAFLGNWSEFLEVPLKELRIVFQDGGIFSVKPALLADGEEVVRPPNVARGNEAKRGWKDGEAHGSRVVCTLERPEKENLTAELFAESALETARRLGREIPYLEQRGPNLWFDGRLERMLGVNAILAEYGESGKNLLRSQRTTPKEAWLADLQTQVQVHFIRAERLYLQVSDDEPRRLRSNSRTIPAVKANADDFASRMRTLQAKYALESQQLERSFPHRLLNDHSSTPEPLTIQRSLDELDTTRTRLERLGLLPKENSEAIDAQLRPDLELGALRALHLFVKDSTAKLQVFEEMADQVELLLQQVNARFQNKQLRIDGKEGMLVVGHNGKNLDLSSLSSGEQQQLVLLYELLFRTKPNTLILIDEPELSLHVVWQEQFLPDLLRITKSSRVDALVATHSPVIVDDRRDLMVGLSGDPA